MSVVSASDARRTLPEQLDRVEKGERVSITRHGRVVAILVSPDVLLHRPAAARLADTIADQLTQARERPLPPPALSSARAEELIADIDAHRADR